MSYPRHANLQRPGESAVHDAPPCAGLSACLADRNVVIVSPHLDDAVFSAYMLLASRDVRITEVATVITGTATSGLDDWSRISGFTSSAEQDESRRIEDSAALTRLGRKFRHLGAMSGQESQIAATLESYIKSIVRDIPDVVFMLPAGAGAKCSPGTLSRAVARVLRRPGGSMRHTEHVAVRDLAVMLLARHPHVGFGFYAEIPYIWSEGQAILAQRLRKVAGKDVDQYVISPNTALKVAAVESYKSQIAPVFGNTLAYRTKVLSHDEIYFMVTGASHGSA